MKKAVLAVALVAVVAVSGCGKKTPPPPPPAPPAAPATPPPAPPPAPRPEVAPVQNDYDRIRKLDIDSINRAGLLPEIHFDFDRAEIRDADKSILAQNADSLKKYDFLRVTIEGHADERGTVEYNLALGERRAKSAYDYLVSLGVPAARMKTVSYGKEVPVCRESTEDCWARNRRGVFTVTGKN